MLAIVAQDRWRLQLAQRWIVQYNFYINDPNWIRMFVRICPYLPFSARICLNQHHWLANRMRSEGIDFKQCANAFLRCTHPQKLQELADSLSAHDLLSCGQKWLACLAPSQGLPRTNGAVRGRPKDVMQNSHHGNHQPAIPARRAAV
jgi:hypothetical protein